ncbi:MAG: tRNA lysidine(34) synthetase TilS [Longimicrobiales bacterium]
MTDGPTDLGARFETHLRRSRLVLPGEHVLVAVSGGLDSVVLLDLLRRLAPAWQLTLTAAHFDHRMRADSATDAAFVDRVCRTLAVPLESAAADPAPRSEAAARAARYAFLRRTAQRLGADRVATAHHADDQVETLLFRMARGTGLRGLAGIPARRGRVVRPLLPFTRAALAAHAAVAGLEWREDPSNALRTYARNAIRHDVLPALRAVLPQADRSLARLARQAREDERAWAWVLDRLEDEAVQHANADEIRLARPRLLTYHPSVRARLLRRVLRRLGSVPDRAGTRAAVAFISSGASGRALELSGDVALEREFETIRIVRRRARQTPDRPLTIAGPEAGSGNAVIGGRRLRVAWGPAPTEDGTTIRLRIPAHRFPLVLRRWQPGDRILRAYGTKKLKKLLAERRIERSARARVAVLADAEGRVLWVPGIGRASDVEAAADGLHITVWDAERS